jgi:hypothetical protein
MTISNTIVLFRGRVDQAGGHEKLLPSNNQDSEEPFSRKGKIHEKLNINLKVLMDFNLSLKKAAIVNLVVLLACILLSTFFFEYYDLGGLLIGLFGALLYSFYLFAKALTILVPNSNDSVVVVGKHDQIIGFIRLVYLDFKFYLLIALMGLLVTLEFHSTSAQEQD